MKATLSEKGQVTIPKPLRDRLGLRAGQELEFRADSRGRLIATKTPARDALDELYGTLELDHTTEELIEELRGPADAVDRE